MDIVLQQRDMSRWKGGCNFMNKNIFSNHGNNFTYQIFKRPHDYGVYKMRGSQVIGLVATANESGLPKLEAMRDGMAGTNQPVYDPATWYFNIIPNGNGQFSLVFLSFGTGEVAHVFTSGTFNACYNQMFKRTNGAMGNAIYHDDRKDRRRKQEYKDFAKSTGGLLWEIILFPISIVWSIFMGLFIKGLFRSNPGVNKNKR
jgi:hypothetical protein